MTKPIFIETMTHSDKETDKSTNPVEQLPAAPWGRQPPAFLEEFPFPDFKEPALVGIYDAHGWCVGYLPAGSYLWRTADLLELKYIPRTKDSPAKALLNKRAITMLQAILEGRNYLKPELLVPKLSKEYDGGTWFKICERLCYEEKPKPNY